MSLAESPAIPIIDVDSHVVEPPDLWTSRAPARYRDAVPVIRWDEETQRELWEMGGVVLAPAAAPAQAGYHRYPPDHPPRLADADPRTWDPSRRLEWMDAYGIQTQLLYPNVAMFQSGRLQDASDAALRLFLVQAYNDFQTDFCAAAPGRFAAVTSLPFWDLPATLDEIDRCTDAGHRGINFTQDPTAFGLPPLADTHWDPMWASVQEKGLPVNFHIASGDTTLLDRSGPADAGPHANYASMGVSFFLSNARTFAQLICGGVCHRFPDVNFVSVESGIGWIPFALDSLDWQWLNCGVIEEHPEYDLMPSEYFARQLYGCFWFERDTAQFAIDILGADNILYETDFPHPTSMSPGPATAAIDPDQYVREVLGGLDEVDRRKILHDNAARLYGLD
jgi:predicted TIM-barrel fold metal-dependent hydrolase